MSVETPTSVPWGHDPDPLAAPGPRAAAARPQFPLVNVLLLVTTALTTTVASAIRQGADPAAHPFDLLRGLPFSATLITILMVHEAGHYLMCLRHRVSASLPYFLPAPPTVFPLGTFGAFIRIRSRFPNRRALFDIGAAGPWAGFVVAVAATVVGLRLSTAQASLPDGPVLELGDSLLTAWLTRLVLHADPSTVILHPVAFAGWFGLFVTSLNLLPAGQLDGGHVLYAAVGRRLKVFPAVLIAVLFWLGLRGSPVWLVWGGIMLAMLVIGPPPVERPAEPLGPGRRLGAALSFVMLVLTFVPEPIRIVS